MKRKAIDEYASSGKNDKFGIGKGECMKYMRFMGQQEITTVPLSLTAADSRRIS